MKLKIRNPFYFAEENETDLVKVLCYHCGKIVNLFYENIRANNYCSECK